MFEPPIRRTSSTQAHSITGVHSILNPTEAGSSQVDKRLPQDSNNKKTFTTVDLPQFRPTLPPVPQRRSSSSPLLAPISKLISAKPYFQHSGGWLNSPTHPPRRFITPVSPALRHAGVGANNHVSTGSVDAASNSGTSAEKVTVSQSPSVHESFEDIYSTLRHGVESSGLTATFTEHSSASRYLPKLVISIPGENPPPLQHSHHPTTTLHRHSHNLNTRQAINPSSQASSPRTPYSTFSSFASSPSITSTILPPLGQSASLHPSSVDSASQSPFMGMNPLNCTPSHISGLRYREDPHSGVAYPGPTDLLSQAGNHVQYDGGPMIPIAIDLKSGSRSQAEKRKANSDASRRFRNRKKNEAALEQRINQLNEQLQSITEETNFYRNERDFFRDKLSEHIGIAQIPPRPPPPSSRRCDQSTASPNNQPSPANTHQQAIGMEGEMMFKCTSAGTSASLLAGSPPSDPGKLRYTLGKLASQNLSGLI